MDKKKQLLHIEDASFRFKKNAKPIFQNVDLTLNEGDIFTLLGPNGAGKSTLLNCISGIYPLSHGNIFIDGAPLVSYSPEQLALVMAYVPQVQNQLIGHLVRDYVVMGRAPYIKLMKPPSSCDYEKADQALEQMGISRLAGKSVRELSGGERQLVQIARALVQETKIILMDEPTNHLDYGNQLRILQIINDLAQKGFLIILTTHMPDHAILLGGKAGILIAGDRIIFGASEEIVTAESLSRIYDFPLHLIYVEELNRTACIAGKIKPIEPGGTNDV